MADNVRERTIRIIAEQAMLEPTDITEDQSPEDLGLDSMGMVEAIFAIEEEFDINVPFNANEPQKSEFDISTVGSIADAVEALVRDQKG